MESETFPLSTRVRKMRKHSHRYHFITELDRPMSAQKQYAPCHNLSAPLRRRGGIFDYVVYWPTSSGRHFFQEVDIRVAILCFCAPVLLQKAVAPLISQTGARKSYGVCAVPATPCACWSTQSSGFLEELRRAWTFDYSRFNYIHLFRKAGRCFSNVTTVAVYCEYRGLV